MPLPMGLVGAACHAPDMPGSDARPQPRWLRDLTGLSDQLRRPEMGHLSAAGAVLVEGWIAA